MNSRVLQLFFCLIIGCVFNGNVYADFWVYEDPRGETTIATIIAEQDPLFIQGEDSSLGFTNSIWWLKIPITNTSSHSITKNIFFKHGLMASVTAYHQDNGHIDVQTSGYAVPLAERSFKHSSPVFTYTLKPNETTTIYVRIENKFVTFLDYKVIDNENLYAELDSLSLTSTTVLSALFVLFIYNLFLFFSTRIWVYGYYVVYLASASVCMAGIFDKVTWVNPFQINVLNYIVIFGAIMYASAFMFINEMFIDKLSLKQQVFAKILAIFVLLHVPFAYLVSPEFVLEVYGMRGTGTIMSLGLLYLTLSAYSRGHPLALYIALGWGMFIVFSALFIMSWAGMLDVTFSRFIAYGVLIEAIIFSLVLSYRMRVSEAELANERMNIILMEKDSEAKSLFLATMSHELRTPLNGIIGLTDLSLQSSSEPYVQDNLKRF